MDSIFKSKFVKVNKCNPGIAPIQGNLNIIGERIAYKENLIKLDQPTENRAQVRVTPFKVLDSNGPDDIDFLRGKCGFVMPTKEQTLSGASGNIGKRFGKICPKKPYEPRLSTDHPPSTPNQRLVTWGTDVKKSITESTLTALNPSDKYRRRFRSESIMDIKLAEIRKHENRMQRLTSITSFNNRMVMKWLQYRVLQEDIDLTQLKRKVSSDQRLNRFRASKNPFANELIESRRSTIPGSVAKTDDSGEIVELTKTEPRYTQSTFSDSSLSIIPLNIPISARKNGSW